eukprot:TRINITY_DN5152_c0_g2_i1.p1 TRINITY_DN5152_c0_g2~~TRINITY_DN5152_c0_g2_i1.p1  ORF type:complete len:428 (-),score=122.45 TRINITY_DN5152_c0_g2_i1:90-1373(-)
MEGLLDYASSEDEAENVLPEVEPLPFAPDEDIIIEEEPVVRSKRPLSLPAEKSSSKPDSKAANSFSSPFGSFFSSLPPPKEGKSSMSLPPASNGKVSRSKFDEIEEEEERPFKRQAAAAGGDGVLSFLPAPKHDVAPVKKPPQPSSLQLPKPSAPASVSAPIADPAVVEDVSASRPPAPGKVSSAPALPEFLQDDPWEAAAKAIAAEAAASSSAAKPTPPSAPGATAAPATAAASKPTPAAPAAPPKPAQRVPAAIQALLMNRGIATTATPDAVPLRPVETAADGYGNDFGGYSTYVSQAGRSSQHPEHDPATYDASYGMPQELDQMPREFQDLPGADIVDVNAADQTAGYRYKPPAVEVFNPIRPLANLPAQAVNNRSGKGVSQRARQQGHITHLVFSAAQKVGELDAKRAEGRKTKFETQMKYGW